MAITDKIYLRNHRQLVSQLDTRIPRRVFAGATLDILYAADGLTDLNESTQEPILAFAEDFLDCDCETAPFCGHPERKFVRYLLELRTDGFEPEEIIDVIGAEYNLTAYAGDLLSFLDEAVRRLEALEALAGVENHHEYATRTERIRRNLEG